jgi:SAM-dependent methyltransferase
MAQIDFIPHPPTSFPFRDLFVLEQLPVSSADTVCEIGVGSGGTTARLANMAASVTGFEISDRTIDELRYLEGRFPNLRFVVGDVTVAEHTTEFGASFSRVVSCDTLEHVSDPAAFFRAIHHVLAPGGEFLVTFPNEPPHRMHGITRFDHAHELEALVREAGLECRVGTCTMTDSANAVADTLGWGPLKLARRVLRRGRKKHTAAGGHAPPPQTFHETHFMKNIGTFKKVAPLINLYWYGVLKLMAARGPAFHVDWHFERAPFQDCQVFLSGRKPAVLAGRNELSRPAARP